MLTSFCAIESAAFIWKMHALSLPSGLQLCQITVMIHPWPSRMFTPVRSPHLLDPTNGLHCHLLLCFTGTVTTKANLMMDGITICCIIFMVTRLRICVLWWIMYASFRIRCSVSPRVSGQYIWYNDLYPSLFIFKYIYIYALNNGLWCCLHIGFRRDY